MDKDICDYYEPIGRKDKMCKSFTGDKDNKRHIDNCRRYCSTMDLKRMMEEGHDVMERHKGALRRK